MVFVFFVQPGDMMTFDNEISIMQSVSDLKEKIKEICGINLEQQVLLINGGEPLDATKNLCSYMAGTDTNPIYLFSTNYDISKIRILDNLNYNDSDLLNSLTECCSLPVSLSTVKKRAQVAQEFYNLARRQLEFCESFVHDQYMQQQGWSAVIANLEDIVTEFKKRWDVFRKVYDDFIADKDTYNVFFQHFEEDKTVLQRIPILGTLLETQKDLETMKSSETNTSTSQSQETENSTKEITLFEWISSSDSNSSLDNLFEVCRSNLVKFETEIVPSLEKQVQEAVQTAEKTEKKEIEGLNKRLFDLQELLIKIKKYVEHQSDMAQSFQQNQHRASNLRDLSILPDLCATHLKQLEYVKEHHKKLMEDRNRIVKAKFELSKSLITRIGWVQEIESWLFDLDNKLVYFHEHLQRLRKHLQVFQQLHLAPTTYLSAVTEVVRRRNFSQMFLLWASDLACNQLTIHNEEITRRKEFNAMFEGHFLKTLFPGLSDMPPSFATEAPAMFDAKLPKITEDDVERLKRELPDYAENLTLPDLTTITNFFMGRSTKDKDKVDDVNKAVEEKLIQAVSDVGLASNLDKNLLKGTGSESCLVTAHGLPHLKDIDKGCESETDTEEFEKVGQSPLELNFDKDSIPQQSAPTAQVASPVENVVEKQDVATSTEDNLQISKTEHEKIKSLFMNMGSLAKQEAAQLRTELNDLRTQVLTNSTSFSQHCGSLSSSWDTLLVERDNQEKALLDKIIQDHKEEVLNLKKVEKSKNEHIKSLEITKAKLEEWLEENTKEKTDLEQQISDLTEEHSRNIEELNKRLSEKDLEKEKSLKELSESLKLEHKAEIDSIKSRFRLMTMERSPSCSSLEKERSGDFISLPSHNATLLAQMTENFELDKENAVLEERHKWENILKEKLGDVERRFNQEKELIQRDVANRVSEDKDNQIDLLMEQKKNLLLEVAKHKTTIQQLADFTSENRSAELIEQIDNLNREKEELQAELDSLRNESRMSVSSSALYESTKSDATTSPVREVPTTSKRKLLNLSLDSCKAGDTVMVVWDPIHESFRILQESKHMFFLHSDCMESLGLSVVEGTPNKTYCGGEVEDKEYCHARKSENRYKVPKGAKFFRVKVKPSEKERMSQSLFTPRTSSHHLLDMSQSQSSASVFEPVSEEPSVCSPPRSRLTSTQEEDLPMDSEEPTTLTDRPETIPLSPQKEEDPPLPSEPDQSQESSNTTLAPTQQQSVYEEPEELRPHSVEKHFAEDSGIEQSVEAIEHLDTTLKSDRDTDRVPYFTVFETLLQNFD